MESKAMFLLRVPEYTVQLKKIPPPSLTEKHAGAWVISWLDNKLLENISHLRERMLTHMLHCWLDELWKQMIQGQNPEVPDADKV